MANRTATQVREGLSQGKGLEIMAKVKNDYKNNTFCALFSEKKNLVFSRDIYSRKLVKIPTPELYVFYNGLQDAPVEQEMKLSDAFMAECDRIALEVTVKFINVNYEKGAEILKGCKAMNGYSLLLHMIREECEAAGELNVARAMKAKGMTINEICEITGFKRSQVEEL